MTYVVLFVTSSIYTIVAYDNELRFQTVAYFQYMIQVGAFYISWPMYNSFVSRMDLL